jgi:serine phosphatase RsbU (regulator of sigma subunit)
VTFAAAVLDPGRGEMMLLSAGHGPLYFLDASVPRVESFDAHGLPLAVLPQTVYGPAQLLVMKPGDALCLVTDGFAEWQRGDGKMFGAERLMDALRESGRGSAMEIIEALHTTAAAFAAPAKQQDDLTAVVVKRNGP